MQAISVFLDTAKFPDFCWKNADASRTQGVYHVIHIFFGSPLGKELTAMFHHCRICVTDFAPPPNHEQPQKSPSWKGLIIATLFLSNRLFIIFSYLSEWAPLFGLMVLFNLLFSWSRDWALSLSWVSLWFFHHCSLKMNWRSMSETLLK